MGQLIINMIQENDKSIKSFTRYKSWFRLTEERFAYKRIFIP